MSKKIVILANSRKLSGRCVAGKDEYGTWIRLTKNNDGPIPSMEARNYYMLKIVEAEGLINNPSTRFNYHTENSTYTTARPTGNLDLSLLDRLIDKPINIFGIGNYVNEVEAQELNESLIFVKVSKFTIYLKSSGQYGDKLRADFTYNKKKYTDMAVTDSISEEKFKDKRSPYKETYANAYITVSLGVLFNSCAYKLVSGIIIP